MNVRNYVNAGILVLSLLVILYVATRYGFIHCSVLPHWCDVYSSVNSLLYGRVYPNVLLLYGDSGLGEPKLVANYIRNTCRYHVMEMPADSVSFGNLQNYDVVIVERARKLSASQLEMLWDFAASGGRLVLIGDVGVEAPDPEEYLTWEDLGEENKEGIVNPWDRKKEDGTVIQFGTMLLGLKYVGNGGTPGQFSGEVLTQDDILTDGLPRRLDLETEFAATKVVGNSVLGPQTLAATIVNAEAVGGEEPPYPALVRIGYRIVYIAYPPELAGENHMLIYYNLCKVVT